MLHSLITVDLPETRRELKRGSEDSKGNPGLYTKTAKNDATEKALHLSKHCN